MNLQLPKIIFGSSALGNLYQVVPFETKLEIVRNWIHYQANPVIDSAGKYGAGLALESIGRCLKTLKVDASEVCISNKLGWKRVPLRSPEPTFETGVWMGLEYDAVQCMGYDGILECHEQGNALLGNYEAKLLSVHDPDEYLAAASTDLQAAQRYQDLLESYRALDELRRQGKALGIGVGAKDWRLIQRLFNDGVPLDWVMFANSFTLYSHPQELMDLMASLHQAGVRIINSAVFHGGFLIGGDWFDYKPVTRATDPALLDWRDRFHRVCEAHAIEPALACAQFGRSVPGIAALAFNTARPARIPQNVALATSEASAAFWQAMKANQLLSAEYPYL